MPVHTKISCDQPNCTFVVSGSAPDMASRIGDYGWTTEQLDDGRTVYICPRHGSDALSIVQRDLVDAGARILNELQVLDQLGYYVASCSHYGEGTPEEQEHIGDGCVLHMYLLENEYPTGPYVQIIQAGHSMHARLRAGDEDEADTVVLDGWAEEWG